jgi:hypothetical protein
MDELRSENFLPYRDSNADISVVQPLASRYTDCAIRVSNEGFYLIKEKLQKVENIWDIDQPHS